MIEPRALTEQVTMRLQRLEDAPAIVAAFKKNREHLAPWNPSRPEEFFTEEGQQLDMLQQATSLEAGDLVPFVLTSSNEIVGMISLYAIIRGPVQSAVVGYWVDVDQLGRGLASRALLAVIDLARDELALHRIEARTMVDNGASQSVLRKAGFVQIGLAPRYMRVQDEWRDHFLFQLLLND